MTTRSVLFKTKKHKQNMSVSVDLSEEEKCLPSVAKHLVFKTIEFNAQTKSLYPFTQSLTLSFLEIQYKN